MAERLMSDGTFVQPTFPVTAMWDSGGDNLPPDFDTVAENYTYNGSGQLATAYRVSVVDGHTYTQTFTYTSGNLTQVSQWVRS